MSSVARNLVTWKFLKRRKGKTKKERISWDQATVSSQGLPGPGFIHFTPCALQTSSNLLGNLVIVTLAHLPSARQAGPPCSPA